MTTRGRLALALASLVGPAVVLTGCGGSDPAAGPTPAPTSPASPSSPTSPPTSSTPPIPRDAVQYVALGDSYAAAPGVPTSDTAAGCFRSDHNYAHLLAAADPDILLTDVTCSGATSDDVISEQVPAVTADTDLVTIGIGGNDFGLFTQVIGGCLAFARDDSPDDTGSPDATTGATPCTELASGKVAEVADDIRANMGAVLDAIAAAAPKARIVVVGYPALLPEDGTTCPDLIPLAPGDYPFVASINRGLSDGLRGEAERRGLDFVDVFSASEGHDVCSTEPWVNGIDMASDGTIPLHPFAVEQAAVAGMVSDLL